MSSSKHFGSAPISASAVYDALKASGMSFPFPQREVRLLGDSKFDSSTVRAKSATAQDGLVSSAKRRGRAAPERLGKIGAANSLLRRVKR